MDLVPAPLFADGVPGPEDGAAFWVTASDQVRLRVGVWGRDAPKGTVLLFPGRTEYIEKYGNAAAELAARGFATLSIDWRGQGLADRLTDDPLIGHVGHFRDYQKDVAAMLRTAYALDVPKPFYLVAHSMGGCIGLRALSDDLPVQAAAFTAPMWGILMSSAMRPAAWVLSRVMPAIGMAAKLVPGTRAEPYVLVEPFEDNTLTKDPGMFEMMHDQVAAHPGLGLGGPGYQWLREAMIECDALAKMPLPNMACVTYLGTDERIVDPNPVHDRMGRWPGARLEMIERAEHEVLMETAAIRQQVFDDMAAHFAAAG